MAELFYLILSAIIPVALFLYFVNKKDTVKEPNGVLIRCFLLGVATVIPVLILELLFTLVYPTESAFYRAFVVAAVTEEGFKFLFLYWFMRKHKEFDQFYDGIVYAVFLSMGFALIENILYVLQGGFGVAFLRSVLSVPGHGLFGVIMGYFFALAKFSGNQQRKIYYWLSFFIPLIFHGLYDFFLMATGVTSDGWIIFICLVAFLVLMVILWRIALKRIKKLVNIDKQINETIQ
jgi:RsiW-degrading membrane proteinase PrsW (M82 family)